MKTGAVMTGSAVYLGVTGIATSFLPHEILGYFGSRAEGALPLIVQVAGAAMFGFAMVNWLARGSLIGGIYNRAVAVGNVAHFVMGALALMRGVTIFGSTPVLLVLTGGHTLFAIAFTWILFRSPVTM